MAFELHELAITIINATPTPAPLVEAATTEQAASAFGKLQKILSGDFGMWEVIGFLGLVTFSSRFIVQWIASELKQESVIPEAFWYLSIAGSLLYLAYALHINDPIFVLSYLFNSAIYLRNLYFIYSKKNKAALENSTT